MCNGDRSVSATSLIKKVVSVYISGVGGRMEVGARCVWLPTSPTSNYYWKLNNHQIKCHTTAPHKNRYSPSTHIHHHLVLSSFLTLCLTLCTLCPTVTPTYNTHLICIYWHQPNRNIKTLFIVVSYSHVGHIIGISFEVIKSIFFFAKTEFLGPPAMAAQPH